ncbi:HMA2 domain-containing protein [Halodesulfovibrio sp.]|jgi:copper chaperone CopZ|uniref:HMA2 domain-containing protein n=1 Tax=Halodesulfovibrio sp. TaxID=1912772 RepID=UPI0025DA171F|nr:hypothetical protein [Halodesulfovibrio sp.]MCT4535923.1 hypothetical protein [Halodesulfovibrio sp.]MCT4626366.1 hypothetical protein [Halodesulfovibrio sp.]
MSATTVEHARFRFRCESLKIEEHANAIKESLAKTKGVVEVAVNKRVGSILVLFDQAAVSADKLFCKIAEGLGLEPEQIKSKLSSFNRAVIGRSGRRVVKRGLLCAGATTLALLAFSEKGHAVAGGVWLTLMAAHLYQNKRTLFS